MILGYVIQLLGMVGEFCDMSEVFSIGLGLVAQIVVEVKAKILLDWASHDNSSANTLPILYMYQ
jgi:hypothetical protein